MSKRSKSKRFSQYSVDQVKSHDERFPYHSTLAEAEAEKKERKRK